MTTVEELSKSIKDKETGRDIVIGASAFFGAICSIFTFGISILVGGVGAYAAKKYCDSEINELRRSKQSYWD